MTMKYETARHAVCCLLMDKAGYILAISRGENTAAWGMPGGKVELNESLEIAVVREMYEETGYVIAAPQSVYTAFVPGETNFMCTTFVAQAVAEAPDAPRSIPFEGEVKWVHPGVLARGPFAEYNQALFNHLNIQWKRVPQGILPFDAHPTKA
jgi:8-oxo-dGTP pyrophosphatase MutT (NUDIX family)